MEKIERENKKILDEKIIRENKGKRIIDFVKDENFLAAIVDGNPKDLSYIIKGTEKEIKLVDFEHPLGRETFWHTSSHVMAQAVKELFPFAKLTIGPPIENGFHYDFFMGEKTFTPEDLEKIEKRAKEIIERDLKVERIEIKKEEALKIFKERGEDFKIELINEIKDDIVSCYKQGDFIDLCTGPHLVRTGLIKSFKILSSSSSYWRKNEKGPVLQRIYGISFPQEELLKDYLNKIEEAKKRDHRKLGKELSLFISSEDVGAGLILWLPKGAFIRREIENFLFREHLKRGYLPVYTPHVGKSKLWEISGHLNFYRENMYPEMEFSEEGSYFIKPMNCPFHIQIYKNELRSYRDLPLRLFEFGTVYRYERSGVLHGLTRVRGFTQDDAHIFCTPYQVEDEIKGVIDFALFVLSKFGFKDYKVYISTRPEQYVGTPQMWDLATESLIKAAKEASLKFEIAEGEGAFYGPKIDILIRDAIGREWQCTTIQFDFNLPQRFDLTFRDSDGKDKKPYMIHRALLGSFERFFGVLIEQYEGNFPLWLSPEQVRILPLSEKIFDYARKIEDILKKEGLRCKIDYENEKIGYKIRKAEIEKVPYILVVGKKEEENKTVSVRKHGEGELGSMSIEEFISRIKGELENS
ncbi:MAG: threonine--tRNA ligase [candidate division WOR-3 bacterium]